MGETRWDRFIAEESGADLLRGDTLLVTDLNPNESVPASPRTERAHEGRGRCGSGSRRTKPAERQQAPLPDGKGACVD
ncbi:hypothetical protein GCM10009834_04660 [Streptomonospora arabica]